MDLEVFFVKKLRIEIISWKDEDIMILDSIILDRYFEMENVEIEMVFVKEVKSVEVNFLGSFILLFNVSSIGKLGRLKNLF